MRQPDRDAAAEDGDIIAVFNEERFPFHHDSGQTLLPARTDGGKTWCAPKIVLPWTDTTRATGTAASARLPTARWMVNLTITGFFKRGVKPDGVLERPSR